MHSLPRPITTGSRPTLHTSRGDVRAKTIVLCGEAYLTRLSRLHLLRGHVKAQAQEEAHASHLLDVRQPAHALGDESTHSRGVGGQVVTARYAQVDLALEYAGGFCRWSAKVGFLEGRDVAILGYAGFLEHFRVTFDSARTSP